MMRKGDTTNLAARLQTLAAPGTTLVSEATYRLTQGYFTFRPLGEQPIKGHTPLQVYQLTGRRAGRTRIDVAAEHGLTSFVGRQRELVLLEALLERTRAGHGQIVGVFGEAGMGKSRLLLEFRRRLQQEDLTYLEGRCLSYGQSILYLPLIDILKQCFHLEDDSDQALRERISRGVAQVGLDAPGIAPYLSALLAGRTDDAVVQGLTPEVRSKQTFEALRALFLVMSRQRPLVLAIEDPHWIDRPSEAFLSLLGESLAAVPIMLLLVYRPGYQHRWGEKSYYTQVALHALSNDASSSLIAAVLGVSEVPSDLQDLICRKAEGNPFYLEEITRSFLECGIIQREGAGYHLTRAVTPHDVPETIQDIIVSRVDRLPEHQKRTLQSAAVIGREFAVHLLQRIADIQEQLDDCLNELKSLELIYEKSLSPDLEYMFRHVLTQEATYNSLLGTRRKRLHTAIGLAMEALYPERLAEHYEEIAYHFTQGEAWEKALWYLRQSGDKARLAYANQDAMAFYTHAIEVSGRITPALEATQLLPLYEGRGLVQMLLTAYDEAIADFQTMRQLARAAGNQQKEGESLCHLAYVHWAKLYEDETTYVEQYATEALQLAHQIGDQHILAQSLASLGLAQQARGNLSEAERHLAESSQISRREGYTNSLALSLAFLGLQVYWQGHFARAAQLSQEGLAVSRAIHDSFDEFLTLAHVGLAHWGTGDCGPALTLICTGLKSAQERESKFHIGRLQNILGGFFHELGAVSRAVEYDQASVAVGQQYRLPPVEFSALINLGLDYCALGQYARARSCLEPALDRVQHGSFGTVASCKWRWEMRLLIGLAELSYATGAYEQALRYVEEGLKIALATCSQKYVAKGRALRGKIAVALGDHAAAGAELQRALAFAEQLQSPTLLYPIAYELGQWDETAGQEREAAALYRKANATITRMATALEDEALRAIFLQSATVQAIDACVARLGG